MQARFDDLPYMQLLDDIVRYTDVVFAQRDGGEGKFGSFALLGVAARP